MTTKWKSVTASGNRWQSATHSNRRHRRKMESVRALPTCPAPVSVRGCASDQPGKERRRGGSCGRVGTAGAAHTSTRGWLVSARGSGSIPQSYTTRRRASSAASSGSAYERSSRQWVQTTTSGAHGPLSDELDPISDELGASSDELDPISDELGASSSGGAVPTSRSTSWRAWRAPRV